MQKLYYSISEVCQMVDEEQHILRYWEKEFNQLKPRKNRGGNRIYSERDISLIKTIKSLLRKEKLSLKGAKEHITNISKLQTEDNLFSGTQFSSDIPEKIKPDFESKIKKSKKLDTFSLKRKEVEEIYSLLVDFSRLIKA